MRQNGQIISQALDAWLDHDNYAKAERLLRKQILESADPLSKSEAYMYLGHVQEGREKYKDAIKSFDKALKLARNHPNENFIRAYSTQGKGMTLMHSTSTSDLDNSISLLKKALATYDKCDPNEVQTYKESCLSTLVFVFLLRGKVQEAERRIKRILETEKLPTSDMHELLADLGHSFFKRKKYERSKHYYERALSFPTNDNSLRGETLCYLGRTLYHLAKFGEAIKLLKQSLDLIKSNKELYATAKMYVQKALPYKNYKDD